MVRGMNSAEMQKNNRTLVFKLLQERGMITRAEIAVELNLQKATITNIINEFFDMGIVEGDGDGAVGRRGEKLRLKVDNIYTMSIGITRKDFQFGIFDLRGQQLKHCRYQFKKEESFREVLDKMKEEAISLVEEYGDNRILGVCLAVPGLFINRPERGEEIFMVSEFEELSNIDVHTELEEALGRKILIKHDAKLSAYAEWHCAEEIKGIDRGSLAIVRSRGYGIGCGFVVNGNIVNGHLGLAGEAGYMGINFNRHKKGEEGRGTLEYSAGVESVVRYMKERLYEFPESPLNENSNYMDVFEAYKHGDELADWAVSKVAWMLGYGIANIIYIINKIRSAVRNFVPEFVERNATIRYSKINEDSFMLGGYYYTLETLCKRGNIFELIRTAKALP